MNGTQLGDTTGSLRTWQAEVDPDPTAPGAQGVVLDSVELELGRRRDHGWSAGRGRAVTAPSSPASFSATIRARLHDRPGTFARLQRRSQKPAARSV